MKVIRFDAAETVEPQEHWKRVSLCSEGNVSVEFFEKPAGHATPRHEHPNAQVLVVLKGSLKVATDEEEQELAPFDAVYIPADEPHVVTNPLREPSGGIDIFVPGRSFDFWLKRLPS